MELCFYNAVMTGMAANGRQFTYVNQLASTDSDLSKRAEWFTCACCPPNVTRLLGYIGGYLWTSQTYENSVAVNVHMYTSAKISIPLGNKVVEIEQKSNWPWEGNIRFAIRNSGEVPTTIRLRIPGWATTWRVRTHMKYFWIVLTALKVSPDIPDPQICKGYLTLPPSWLKANPGFQLNIPLPPRFISPHPYTNQDVVALARGPLVYCVEDFDNSWVDDHFKSLALDPACSLSERCITTPEIGDAYIGLTAHNAASRIAVSDDLAPHMPLGSITQKQHPSIEQLHFIPYALRDNRGGKGHMRVGIRRKR
jgi:DUF1680 family protein